MGELCDDLPSGLPTSAPGLGAVIAKRVLAVCASRIAAADVRVDAALQHTTADADGAAGRIIYARASVSDGAYVG